MDFAQLKNNIINMLSIHLDQTGHEEMEIAEIASHLKVPVDRVENAINSLAEAGMVRASTGDRYVTILKKGYEERQRS